MTTIYVTHDQREALTMSDRVAVIAGGRVQQIDAPRAIYDKPSNRFVAEFIGESAFLDVESRDGALHCAGTRVDVADAQHADGCVLMLRPERVRIGDALAREGHNVLHARIVNVVYQGDTYLVQAQLDNGSRISARGIASVSALDAIPEIGATAAFGFSARDAVLVKS